MNRAKLAFFVLLGIGGYCHGSIVLFAPEVLEVDRNLVNPGPTDVPVAVILTGFPSQPVDAFDIPFVASPELSLLKFQYAPEFGKPDVLGPLCGFSGCFFNLLSLSNNQVPVDAFPVLGALTVDLTGVANGDYHVTIDPEISALYRRGIADPLVGMLPIHVVPEPAVGVLLLAGVFSIWTTGRRRGRGAQRPL